MKQELLEKKKSVFYPPYGGKEQKLKFVVFEH